MEHPDERRRERRYSASLRCFISLPADEGDILFPGARLECRTRDLSDTGVGLAAPSIYLGYTCIVDDGRELQLELELGGEIVEMVATPVHYLRLDEGGEATSYLVGLRITEMTEAARAAFASHLAMLDAQK